jgi:feruloyl esterase
MNNAPNTALPATALLVLTLAMAGCGGGDDDPAPQADTAASTPVAGHAAPVSMAGSDSAPVVVSQAAILPSTGSTATSAALPEHCEIIGAINQRQGTVDTNQTYAIKFHMRMPTGQAWNGRFLMTGGGGSNGNLGDALGALPGAAQPENGLSRGFAVISTDSGHDNAVNNDPERGETGVFARDPQARRDFYYNAYDVVTRVGKSMTSRFYGKGPEKSYFMGCSEGGREAMLMTQKFPTHYDGVIAGAPQIRGATQPSSPHADQRLAALATSMGLVAGNGLPALNKTFTDADVQLIASTITAACDGFDGLNDGMVLHPTACTPAVVNPRLDALACPAGKTSTCLTGSQLSAFKDVMAGSFNNQGQALYSTWRYDPGIGGTANGALNQGWRSWFLGSFDAANNNAIKLSFSATALAMLTLTPPVDVTSATGAQFMLNYDYRSLSINPAANFPASGIYTDSPGEVYRADSTDLSTFKNRGSKLIIYNGMADAAIAYDDISKYYTAMDAANGASTFARFFPIPGMNHCSGGPGLDRFDALTAMVNWVEKGTVPDSMLGIASNPAYWGVASRSRPLCAYPKVATYKGTGNINDAVNFTCQ